MGNRGPQSQPQGCGESRPPTRSGAGTRAALTLTLTLTPVPMTARETLGPFTAGEILDLPWWYERLHRGARRPAGHDPRGDRRPSRPRQRPQEMVNAYCDAYNATATLDTATLRRYAPHRFGAMFGA